MRRRRKRDIVIELTALLDVIMIMIFMVMNENSKLVSEAQNELSIVQQENIEQAGQIDELSAELAEVLAMLDEGELGNMLERLKNTESRLEAYEAINDEIIVLNVELTNSANNAIRTLTYGNAANPDSLVSKRSNSDSTFNEACNNFKVFVSDYVGRVLNDDKNSVIVCVVFSYDPNKVYYDDFTAIEEALKGAESRANSGNFRYRTNPILSD